ncbi:MAG: lamin tail domain-containing protein, partial [Phycisphaerae bacterium]|nr:lamin tail domain-containing protein [Phycisphaerae bacterium]
VHQNSPTSGDVSFDLELEGSIPASGGTGKLNPGMNRVLVQAFDGPAGWGNPVESKTLEIQYDTGSTKNVSGVLAADPIDPRTLTVTTRDSYLPGYPVLVRAELIGTDGKPRRDIWDATAVISVLDNPAITLSATEIHLINGLGSALVTIDGSGDFTLQVSCDNQTVTQSLTQLQAASMTTARGTLSGSQTWSGIVHITGGDFTIPAGATLTLSPGTMVLIDGVASGDAGTDIDVLGSIQSLGTAESPVTIAAFTQGQNFGELHFANADASLFQYTDIHQGGRSPGVGHTGTGPVVRVSNSTIVFDHANLTDNPGKIMHSEATSSLTFRNCLLTRSMMGPEMSGTALLFEDSWLTDMHGTNDADGMYVTSQQSGQTCVIRGGVSALIDDDGLDLLGPTITIEDYLIHDTKDKGLSIYGGTTIVSRCLIVETNIAPEDPTVAAVAAKAFDGNSATIVIDRSTIVATRSAGVTDFGIQSNNKTGTTSGRIYWTVTNSIIDATDPVKADVPYLESDFHIDYSDVYGEAWPGTENLNSDPMFVNRAEHNYHLASGSPCINSGDPAQTDPDGSRADQGYSLFGINPVVFGDTAVWKSASGPYRVTGNLTIPAGVTLSIEAGTTVFVDPGVTIRVEGTLDAGGDYLKMIRICKTPGTTGAWGGMLFADSTTANRIRYAIIEQARSTAGMIGITNSRLVLENDEFGYTGTEALAPLRRIHINNSSVVVRNCVFTDMCLAGQVPTNNTSEHIWGAGILTGGEVLLEGNTFGKTPGHNDAFDFDSQPGQAEIPCVRNNHFLGGGDDALDLETDAYIEGNVFENYIKDAYNTDPQESNVISAGAGKRYWMARNVFANCGHVVQIKDDAFLTFVSNTVVNSTISAIYFGAPPAAKGKGCDIDGCIFFNTPTLFPLEDVGVVNITLNRSIVPTAYLGLGTGNLDADPLFVDAATGDYHLRSGSPAAGTGPAGLDMGAEIAAGAIILTGPNTLTYSNTAQFSFYGAGVVGYSYRLDDGIFGTEQIITQPLILTNLAEGPHKLEVVGRDYSSHWQLTPSVWEWTVDSEYGRILIHEVVANPYRGQSDWIELYNDSAATINLKGYSLSDSPDNPGRFVFTHDTLIGSGQYLQLYSNDPGLPGAVVFGFGFSSDGEDVYLFNPSGIEIDHIQFGPQPVGLSIGRVGPDRQWTLTTPTPLAVNDAAATGDPIHLRINEWLTDGSMVGDDFIELYNRDRLPVELTGLALTDNVITQPRKSVFGPLTFVDGFGFVAVQADKQTDPGHVNFRLNSEQEIITLTDTGERRIDTVLYHQQTTDISQGRNPDGDNTLAFFADPTPGNRNVLTVVINEVLAHAHAEAPDWIELYNSGTEPVTLDGWYLSDDQAQWDKYRIPTGSTLQAGEYKVFYEDQTFNNAADPGCKMPFALSENGDAVYLTAVVNGARTGYQVWEDFGASQTGVAFGRYRISTGMWHFVPMSVNTPEGLNGSPKIGPVVISEIFYNPGVSQDQEFIELYNPTTQPVEMKSYDTETGEWLGWRFTDGIDFTFPLNVTIPASGYLIIAKSPSAFTARFGAMPANVTVIGSYDGQLNNGGERLELSLPGDELDGTRYFIVVDRVDYGNSGRWANADGNGQSLTRVTRTAYADDPANWQAVSPTPGQ